MIGVRFHGRGGQGVVTAAELLSVAAFDDGLEALAFPSFGSERMGAPVMAFCRFGTEPIRTREPVSEPDVVVVADLTLLHDVDVVAGLVPGGIVVLNSTRMPSEIDLRIQDPTARVVSVAASDLARLHLGRPLPNVCLLGAVASLTGAVSMAGIEKAVHERFSPQIAAANVAAARAAYDAVGQVSHA